MDKVLINNAQGESGIVNVVRYFKLNNNNYIIYTLNEVDGKGPDGTDYVKLYMAKVTENGGKFIAETITNDSEWNNLKNIIKDIIKAVRNNLSIPVEDLNIKQVSNIDLKSKKVFKLNKNLVDVLSQNKPKFEDVIPTQETNQMNRFDFNSSTGVEGYSAPNTFNVPNPAPINDTFGSQQQTSSFDFSSVEPQTVNQIPNTFNVPNPAPINDTFNSQPQTNSFDFGYAEPQTVNQTPNTFNVPNPAPVDDNFEDQLQNTGVLDFTYAEPQTSYQTPNTFNVPNPAPINDTLESQPQTSSLDFDYAEPQTSYQTSNTFNVPNPAPVDDNFEDQLQKTSTFDFSNLNSYGSENEESIKINSFDDLIADPQPSTIKVGKPEEDYKTLYETEKEKVGKLEEEVLELKNKLEEIKRLLG